MLRGVEGRWGAFLFFGLWSDRGRQTVRKQEQQGSPRLALAEAPATPCFQEHVLVPPMQTGRRPVDRGYEGP